MSRASTSGVAISRRAFLRAGRRAPAPLRPPWAAPDFAGRCTGCEACAEACPESVIATAPDGLAELSFESGGCTFCGACATACEPGAIDPAETAAPFAHAMRITSRCLTDIGIVCNSCSDACPEGAIRLCSSGRGVPQPGINLALCTGCGLCVAPCPADAVQIIPMAATPAERTRS
jgi:ferredoxin-type protein NapF